MYPASNPNLIYGYHQVPSSHHILDSTYKSGVEGQIPKGGVGVGQQVERHDRRELGEGLLRQTLLQSRNVNVTKSARIGYDSFAGQPFFAY